MFTRFFNAKTSASRSGRLVAFGAISQVDQFEVEAMEPRILLSAAPIDAPLGGADVSAVPDIQVSFDQAVQQSFVTTSDEISSLNDDEGDVFGETTELPGNEQETIANSDTDQDIEDDSLTDVDPLVEEDVFSQEESALIQIDQVSTVSNDNNFATFDEEVTLVPEEPVIDSVVTELVTTLNAANGPPVVGDTTTSIDSLTSTTTTSTPGLQNEVAGTNNESSLTDGDLSSDESQDFLNIYPNVLAGDHVNGSGDYLLFNGDSTLGSIESAELSQEQIDELLQVAISLWANALPDADIANLTQGITARVANLGGGILGEATGQTITLDATAAGRGWFVDTTPYDHSEFESVDGQLTALADSDASGRIDLLTVLTHEVGHVLGYGHDSGLAVMETSLGAGERTLLSGAAPAGGTVPVTGAYTFAGGTITGQAGDPNLIFRIFDNQAGANSILDVQVINGSTNAILATYNDVSTINAILPGLNDTIRVDLDLDTTWTLSGLGTGSVSVDGWSSIAFSGIEHLIGTERVKDTFIFNNGGIVAGSIDGRGGVEEISLGGFLNLGGDNLNFSITSQRLTLTGRATIDLGGLLTITGNFLLEQFDVTLGGNPNYALLGAGATGLALQVQVAAGTPSGTLSGAGTLQMLRLTNNTTGDSWLGMEATGMEFTLDYNPLLVSVTNGAVAINQAPTGMNKLDWTLAVAQSAAPFNLTVNGSTSFSASGSATVSLDGFLEVTGNFSVREFDVTLLASGGDAAYAQLGSDATGLAVQVQIAAGTPSGTLSGAGTLQMLRLTNNTTGETWLGLEGTQLAFALDYDPLLLSVTNGTVSLNQAPTGKNKLDWTLAVAQSAAPFNLTINGTTNFSASGSATVSLDGFLTVTGNFSVREFDVTLLASGGDAAYAQLGSDATGLAVQVQIAAGTPSGTLSGAGTLQMLRLTNNTTGETWLGLEGTQLAFALDYDPLLLSVTNGTVALNQAPTGKNKLNWTLAVAQSAAPFNLTINGTTNFSASGSATVSLDGFLTVTGNFSVREFDVTLLASGGDAAYAQLGSDATGLAVQVQIAAGTPSGTLSGAGTLQMLRLTNNTTGEIWLGLEGTQLAFALDYDPLLLSVTNGTVALNQAPAGKNKLDWTLAVAQSAAPFNLTVNGTTSFSASGNATVSIDGYLTVNAFFSVTEFDVTLATPGGNAAYAQLGADATGLALQLDFDAAVSGVVSGAGTLKMLRLTNNTTSEAWVGIEATGLTFNMDLGPLDFSITNGSITINQAPSGKNKLNWNNAIAQAAAPFDLSVAATVNYSIGGTVTFEISNVVSAMGTIAITSQTVSITDPDNTSSTMSGDLLTVNLTNAYLFVGYGATLSAGSMTVAADAIGFEVGDATGTSGVSATLAVFKSSDGRTYTGLESSFPTVAVRGLADIGFTATVTNLSIDYNDTSVVDGARLDWSAVTQVSLSLTSDDNISITGTVLISFFGFVEVRGNFAFTYTTNVEMYVAGASNSSTFNVTTIGFEDVDVFVGDGPYFNGASGTNASAVGLLLKDLDIAIALFDPTSASDSSKYYAISARAESIQILGLDFSAGTSSFSASGYRVEVNGGKNSSGNPSALDFTRLDDGKLSVPTGIGFKDFDYSSKLERIAIENAVLMIEDFVYISGGFSITRQSGYSLTLSDNTTTTVDVLVFGGGNVDLFIGDGPYFEDTNGDGIIDYTDDRNPDALGLVVESANFGLVMMKTTSGAVKKYTALKITADYVGFVGLDEFKFSATGISLEYNAATGATPNVVAKFSPMAPYVVDTGNGSLSLDFGTKLLRASTTGVELQISDYVFVKGSLAFEKGPTALVTLSGSGGTRSVTTLKVGAENVTMFFGANGPYWTDLDNDNVIDTGETSDRAIGVQVSNASLAMVLMKPVSGSTTKYIGLKATASSLGFVGVDAFQLSGSNIVVNLNIASGGGATAASPVVNFSLFSAEAMAVFDSTNNGITVAELRTLSGQALYAGLFTAGDAGTKAVSLDEILNALDVNNDGALSLAEVEAFVANDPAVTAADVNGNGRIEFGMEIATGTGYVYLDEPGRRIFASADNVLINVSEFLYVTGSVAIDLGARETVTINTGIPRAIADLVPVATIANINAALADLSTTLSTLEADLLAAFDTVVDDLKTAIDTAVDNAVATITAQIIALGQAVTNNVGALTASVESTMQSSLDSARSISMTAIEGIIETFVDTLAKLVTLGDATMEAALNDFLSGLLEPFAAMLAEVFDSVLGEAITKVINRIGDTVIGAVDNAVGEAVAAIEGLVSDKVDPQLARIYAEMDKLNEKLQGAITPVFAKLQNIANIQISVGADRFSQLTGVEVEVTAIGVSNATAFVGLPPAGGFNMSLPLADQYGASGLLIENLTFGIAMFKPVENKMLPTFYAGKITATTAQFRVGDGDNDPTNDFMRIIAQGIVVEFNLGGPIVKGAGSLFGNATIDFVASFPDTDSGGPDQIGFEVQTGTTTPPVLLDFEYEYLLASIARATIQISEFVYISASIAIEKGAPQTFNVAPGLLPTNDLTAIAALLGVDVADLPLANSIPALGATSTEVSVITFGASNVHAFVGMGGPYWSYERDAVINGGDGDGQIDANEINSRAVGIVINDFDFGMAIMKPTLAIDPVKYFALSASARNISLVGMPGVTLTADHLLVQINMSTPSLYGNSLLPVINFGGTPALAVNEQQGLFDILDTDNNNQISVAEMNAAFVADYSATGVITTVARLVQTLDVGGAPPVAGQPVPDGKLSLDEVLGIMEAAFETANGSAILALDADGDGKFDPPGFEVNTGGQPVYLTMNSSLIRAQGFVQLDLFGTVILTGSVAFELGPRQNITLADGSTKEVTTMTIGAANVVGFVGVNGPYWTDTNGDYTVQTGELNSNSVGFHITDLDLGIMVMAATNPADLSVYLSANLSVTSFGLIGVTGFTASGALDIELNVGFGLTGFDPSVAAVDMVTSFSEVTALFVLMDADANGTITLAEQNLALAAGNVGQVITSVTQLSSVLNANGTTPPDAFLTLAEVKAKLLDTFETANQAAIDGLDTDDDGRIDMGFEVNTGNPASPVVLNADDFLVRIQLGGVLGVTGVFRLSGIFLFQADSTSLKAFLAASLEVGPDIGGTPTSKIFLMNALGALVITGDGIAGDINISVSLGGALRNVLQLTATARIVFNYTGVNQTITIPSQYVGYLTGATLLSEMSESPTFNPNNFSSLTGPLDSRFTMVGADAVFTINAGAPRLVGSGYEPAPYNGYFLVTLNGSLTIARTFTISGNFHLKVTGTGASTALDMGFNGSLNLGGFATINISGGAFINRTVFAAYVSLGVNFSVLPSLNGGVTISGTAILKINTSTSAITVNGQSIAASTYSFAIQNVSINIFNVVTATGSFEAKLSSGVFSIAVTNGSISLFGLATINISGYFNTNGNFSFTGSVGVNLGNSDFGINATVSVTLTTNSFTGSGSSSLTILGESFNIASAELYLNWGDGSWSIYAEGPLSVWVRLSGDKLGNWSIDGGIGFFGDVIEALGVVADAIAAGVVDAVNAIGEAFADLGSAIYEFGEDVVAFFSDVGTAIADAAAAVWDEVSSWFESERTVITKYTITPANYYQYTYSYNAGTLTINNGNGLYGEASQLNVWILNGNLIIDAPDYSRSVAISSSQNQRRDYKWDGLPPWGYWGGWYNVGAVQYQYATIDITNATAINLTSQPVTKIVINGTNNSETIVLDRNTIGGTHNSITADVYANGGDDVIAGTSGNDLLVGGDGNDVIFGYNGNDTIWGDNANGTGTGADKLFGGLGNDILRGGNGDDMLDENKDKVDSQNPNPPITGETNTLDGGAGNDKILGSPGVDTITGGSGNDVLVGLQHTDTYIFLNGFGTDSFVDYLAAVTLDFSGVTANLDIDGDSTGFTAIAGAGNQVNLNNREWISNLQLGSGSDNVNLEVLFNSSLARELMTITDAGGSDTLIVDDSADGSTNAGNLTSTRITGLGMGDPINQTTISTADGIAYSNIENLQILMGSGGDTFTVVSTHVGSTTLNTGAGGDTVLITGASGSVAVNGEAGADIFNVRAIGTGSSVTLNGGADADIFNIGSGAPSGGGVLTGISGLLTVNGDSTGTNNDVLNVDVTGASTGQTGTITASTITGFGMTGSIGYGTMEAVNVNLSPGDDVFNIQSISAPTIVSGGSGSDRFNIGSLMPTTGGVLSGIAALLTIDGGSTGSNNDVMYVDATGATVGLTGSMTGTTIIGLGMTGSISYTRLESMNVDLGQGGDNFTVTSSSIPAVIHGWGGDDRITVTSTGATMTVYGDAGADTITINGAGAAITVNGGTEGDTITLNAATAAVTLNGDAGNDLITVNGTSATFTINGGANDDSIRVRASAAASFINTGTGINMVDVGSTDWGTDGNVNAVLGALTINGGGTDTVRVNDRAETAASTLVLTDSLLTGLGLVGNEIAGTATAGISYSSIESLIIHSGAGLSQANIRSTHAVTTTTIRSRGTGAVFNVGSLAPAIGGTVNAVLGRLVIEALGTNEILNVDDTGDATANIGMLSATRITGFGMGDPDDGIEYSGVETLNLNLGSGGNTVYIIGSHSNTTVVNTGAGTGLVNRVYVGSVYNTVWTSASLENIAGSLTINGQATNNEITFDNGDDTAAGTGVLTSTTFAHTAMSGNAALTNAINYNTFDVVNVTLGDGNDNFYVASTPNGSTTTIRSGDETAVGTAINDVVNVNTIGGDFVFIGGTGNDIIRINYDRSGLQTFNNGIANGARVTLIGGNGSDLYEIGLSGIGSAVIDVVDSGNGNDVVNVWGTNNRDVFILEPFAVSSYEMVTNGAGDLEFASNGNFQKVNFNADVEELNVHGLDADDYFNVRATSVLTNLEGEGGNDAFFVTSVANYTTKTAVNVPGGNLNGILAVLNIDGGIGTQILKISDADSTVADTNVYITDTIQAGAPVGLASDREITITGLAPAAISLRAPPAGDFTDGIVIASGSGDDIILVDGAHYRATETFTYLYTGYGSDRVTVTLDANTDGTLILDTQGPYGGLGLTDNDLVNAIGSTQSLTIRTGEGDDLVVGGSGNDNIDTGVGYDIIFGSNGADTIHAGLDSGPDVVVGDSGYIIFISGGITYTIYSETADFAAAAWIAFLTRTSFTEIGTSNTGVGGNDIITSGNGSNVVLGGFGIDQITGGDDRDVVLGDNGAATFNTSGVLIGIASSAPTIGGADVIDVGAGDNTVIGGFGSDQITGGDDRDVVIGDNGSATFDATGVLTFITTSDAVLADFYNDEIITGGGFNTVLGGNGVDTITGGAGTDVVLGDNGSATFVNSSGVSLLTNIVSTDETIGGDDIISVGSGYNTIIGGFGVDRITGGANEDVVIGDNGEASFNLFGILTSITTIEPTIGGNDIIQVGDGYNVVIGGNGEDQITGGAGRDVVVGDNGSTTFSATGILLTIGTLDPTIGGVDTIDTGAGDNTVLGGIGGDQITGGDGRDVVIGDNGSATFDATGVLTFITTSDAVLADFYNDVIITGGGFNTVLGGNGVDTITGGAGTDVVLGDNGSATFVNSSGTSLLTNIVSTDETIGGDDIISVGSGYNTIIGGFGADDITGGDDQDVVIGDNGEAVFNLAGFLTSITTIEPTIGGEDIIEVGDGYNVVIGGFGDDQITGGADRDVVVGDNGSTTFGATGILLTIGTLDPTIGGVDTIDTGAGDNTVLGGIGGDQITGGDGRDVVIGDNGNATFDATGVLTFITTSDAGEAGAYNDSILTGGGFNTVLGGNGADTITGAAGNDVILGDNGSATFVNVSGVSLLTNIISTDAAIGGDDLISVGNGFNAVIGGFGADDITGGDDQDVVIGDNGEAVFNLAGFLTSITTIEPTIGGEDIIEVGDGYNVVIGGFGEDQITGGADRDVVVGDNGSTTFGATGILLTIGTLDPTVGGVDTIDTGAGDNTVLGGIGGDQITGGDGRDVVIGDNGNATFDTTGVLTFITTSDAGEAGAYNDSILTGGGFNTVLGGNGADTITGGAGTDVVLGDNGSATFVNASGVSLLTQITSTDEMIGDIDTINVSDGFNTVIGGVGADQITGGDDQDVIIGDNGVANFSLSGILTTITTTFPSIGGVDVIYTGLGDNAVLGGFGGDLITGGDGRDVVVGDNGNATFNTSGVLIDITTSDPTFGGVDIIQVGNGFNTILGGIGGDLITGGNDRDVVIGDNGNAQFNGSGVLVAITTTDPDIGDADVILTGDGDNVALGGFGADQITGGIDGDVVVGDNGRAVFSDVGILTYITTLDPTIGGVDIILVGNGDNIVLGGIGGDQITGGADRDVVIGDNGNATFDATGVLIGLLTADASLTGDYDDIILTGNGFNTVLGGNGADRITGGADRDVVIGDNGSATFINSSGQSLLQLIVSTDDAIGDDDIISVGNGRNTVIGGFGADRVTGGLNEDVVVGDNGSATFTDAGILTFITTLAPTIGGADIILVGDGDNAILGGIGADRITGGNDRDVVIGDNGNMTFDTTGVLIGLLTTDASLPGDYDDVILTGNGFNTVLAGNGADQVTGGSDRDVVLGDNGSADFINASGVSLLQLIVSTDDAIGGNDIISVGNGRNTVIGGFGADRVTGGLNEDVVVGDNGRAVFNTAGILTYITTTSPAIGGVDVILVSDGENTVLGGFDGDQITGGDDRDVVVGDNGNATFTDAGVLTYITTTEPAIGGDDEIFTGGGDNTVLGGYGADEITGGDGRDVVIGDNGNATFDTTGVLLLARTSDATVPGSYDDVIFTGNGFNTVLAGNGNDSVTGGTGRDVVIGDNGVATFDNVAGISLLREILSTDTAIGGDDTIAAGAGRNVMIGGFGRDLMTSGVDDDIAVGDNGHAFFSVGGVMTYITTISPEIGDIDTINVSDGDNTVIGGFQGDFITSGSGRDVILGDNGNATFNDNDVLTYITTTEPSIGDVDVIDAGDGDNVVIGGQAGDIISSGNGRDVVIGDNGYAVFNAAARLTFVTTTDPTIGGDDLINAGDGDNVVLAGFGEDEVTTGLHDDIVVGDNGYAIFNSSGVLTYVTTTEPEIGGDDLIDAGDGRNIVLAGYGSDRVTSGSGQDVVVGDNGYAVFDDSGPLTFITTTSPEIGGDDVIETGAEEDIVFGGQGADTIGSGAGADLVLGDNGYAEFDASGSPTFITTTDFGIGGNDLVFAGSGRDLVIGGTADDEIYGQAGHDTLIGDQAYWSDELTTPRFVELIDETLPGDDRIYGGDGMDLILSGGGDDWNEGGNDNDAIFAGYGDDFLWGGEGRDRMTGGPGGDWIDGGFGGDFIYVDVFDTWATGFPQDTVIMGRMTTTGLLFSNDLIRNYGDADAGDSAAFSVIRSMERLIESGRASIVPVSMDGFWFGRSPILNSDAMEALLERGYDAVRWGGDGSSILRLSMDRLGVPQLIGIGDFIEQHWYDLLPLYN